LIIHNCKSIFEEYYVNSSVEFLMRQTNETTHILVKVVTTSASFEILVKIHIF